MKLTASKRQALHTFCMPYIREDLLYYIIHTMSHSETRLVNARWNAFCSMCAEHYICHNKAERRYPLKCLRIFQFPRSPSPSTTAVLVERQRFSSSWASRNSAIPFPSGVSQSAAVSSPWTDGLSSQERNLYMKSSTARSPSSSSCSTLPPWKWASKHQRKCLWRKNFRYGSTSGVSSRSGRTAAFTEGWNTQTLKLPCRRCGSKLASGHLAEHSHSPRRLFQRHCCRTARKGSYIW